MQCSADLALKHSPLPPSVHTNKKLLNGSIRNLYGTPVTATRLQVGEHLICLYCSSRHRPKLRCTQDMLHA